MYKNLITENMVVGTQLVDFINKIKQIANNDLYLKGALFLYDRNKFEQYSIELLDKEYKDTEDIVFVFSLFEDKAQVFEKLKTKLIQLLGKERTISPINNIKIYAYIINNIYGVINKRRKKDIDLLKALCVIPTKLLKEDSNEYKILTENYYSKEEIAYLNYAILFYSSIPKTVRIGNSIVEEKIVTRFCKVILNDYKEYNQNIYELVKELIDRYRVFDIKYAENRNLKEALLEYEKVNIVNPTTFMNFYEIFDNNLFTFNILDEKWDILAKNMDMNIYRNLFDDYIEYKDMEKEDLQSSIDKYEQLTQTSYIDSFLNFSYRREYIFSKLVDKNIISLIKYYEKSEDTKENNYLNLTYLKKYVNGVENRNAFLFLQYILEDKNYPINKIEKFEFNLKSLYGNIRYWGCCGVEININKDFLNMEERKKLLYWLDNYMFKMYPNDYLEFATSCLKSDAVLNLISKERLKKVYFKLIENDNELLKDKKLREIYLTQEELKKIENKEKAEKERKLKQEKLEKQEKIQGKFNTLSKTSFKELYDFCYIYKWNSEEWNICSKIVKEFNTRSSVKFSINDKQIIELMKLLTLLIEEKSIDVNEFKQYILEYLEKEDINNGELIRAC